MLHCMRESPSSVSRLGCWKSGSTDSSHKGADSGACPAHRPRRQDIPVRQLAALSVAHGQRAYLEPLGSSRVSPCAATGVEMINVAPSMP
eukprot:1160851-Pelagomonas_calceolata.AAC.3